MGKSPFSSLFIKSLLGLMLFLSPLCLMAQEEIVDVAPKSKHWKVGILGGYDQNYHIVDMNYMSDIKYDKYTSGMTYGLLTMSSSTTICSIRYPPPLQTSTSMCLWWQCSMWAVW